MKCRLCLKEKPIQNSHIIPEFLYKPLYDNLHRFKSLSTLPEIKIEYKQKGIREKLLCRDCEQYISKFEKYAKEILNKEVKISIFNETNKLILKGIDYKKFKLFQISLLWRAGISKNESFSEILLDSHEDKLRKMLYEKNPGKFHEYGCLIIALQSKNYKNYINKILKSPKYTRRGGYRCYSLIMGGLFWVYLVSKHNNRFIHRDYFLQENGDLIIAKSKITYFDELLENISQRLSDNVILLFI